MILFCTILLVSSSLHLLPESLQYILSRRCSLRYRRRSLGSTDAAAVSTAALVSLFGSGVSSKRLNCNCKVLACPHVCPVVRALLRKQWREVDGMRWKQAAIIISHSALWSSHSVSVVCSIFKRNLSDLLAFTSALKPLRAPSLCRPLYTRPPRPSFPPKRLCFISSLFVFSPVASLSYHWRNLFQTLKIWKKNTFLSQWRIITCFVRCIVSSFIFYHFALFKIPQQQKPLACN